MFDLMPFDSERVLLRAFDQGEQNVFGEMDRTLGGFETDIQDKGDRYVMEAELPGFEKEDIRLSVENGYLTISAEHREEASDDKKQYIRRERKYGSFARSFSIEGVDTEKISAEYKNGVLVIDLPKRTPAVPPSQRIEIR